MDLVPRFFKKLWLLIRRDDFNRDLEEEIAFHRQQAEKVLIEDGMSPKEARYAAMRQFGNVTRIKEEAHDTVGFQFETSHRPKTFVIPFRQLRKNPGFAITAILILALGVMRASTAIFSAVYPILFEPLPYPQPSKLTMIWETRDDGSSLAVSFGSYRGIAQRNHSFDGLAVVNPWQPAMTGETEPERFDGQRVTFEYFRTLAVAPALGRDFQAADDLFRGPNVVMLSDKLWRRRFGADASIVGHQVKLDDNLYTVVGVMPASFENVLAPEAEIWAPLQYDPSLPLDGPEWGHHLLMVGRLRPGISREQARSELNVILHTVAQIYAKGYDSSGGAPKGFPCRLSAKRRYKVGQAGAARRAGRGAIAAGDRMRECDQPFTGACRTTAGRIRYALRAGSRKIEAHPATAHGNPVAGNYRRRLRNDHRDFWGESAARTQSAGAAACQCYSGGWHSIRFWPRRYYGHWSGFWVDSRAACFA